MVTCHIAGDWSLRRHDASYELHLVRMNEGRFMIAGFERMHVDGQVVNYAQSWLCTVEPDAS